MSSQNTSASRVRSTVLGSNPAIRAIVAASAARRRLGEHPERHHVAGALVRAEHGRIGRTGGLQLRKRVGGVLGRGELLDSHPVADPHRLARLAQADGEAEPPQPRLGLVGCGPLEERAGTDAGHRDIR